MFQEHPSPHELLSFLRFGVASVQTRLRIVRHLLAGCPECQAVIASAYSSSGPLTFPFGNSLLRGGSFLESWESPRRPELDQTTDISPTDRGGENPAGPLSAPHEASNAKGSFDGAWLGCSPMATLFKASYSLRFRDPDQMLNLAHSAVRQVDSTTTWKGQSRESWADTRALAWGYLGNALRIHGKLEAADEAFRAADGYRRKGSLDRIIAAQLTTFHAGLYTVRSTYSRALSLLKRASKLHSSLNNGPGEVATQIQVGLNHIYSGETMLARRALAAQAAPAEALGNQKLTLCLRHNLIRCHIDSCQPDTAIRELVKMRSLYRKIREPLVIVRAIWQEAMLLAQVEHHHNAEVAFERAQRGFELLGLGYEAQVVALDRAHFLAQLGKTDEALTTTREAVRYFREHGRETIGAKARELEAKLISETAAAKSPTWPSSI